MIKKYVLGFIFDTSRTKVLLIKKTKPDWQKGKFNGIGGKIEQNETPSDAMTRECFEEADLKLYNWVNFAEIKGKEPYRTGDNPPNNQIWSIECYYMFTNQFHLFHSKTEELIEIFDTKLLPQNKISNLSWLIPMALSHKDDRADKFIIEEIIY
jgi:8-oxo-dGTP diphosphatase